jgi:cell division protein FtsZ
VFRKSDSPLAVRQPRMPAIEEFPQPAQRQYAAQQGRIETIAGNAIKKKGLLERLASVGLGRKDEYAQNQHREPKMTGRSEPKIQQGQPQAAAKPSSSAHIDPTLDDDQLEIPAFLRRQAN